MGWGNPHAREDLLRRPNYRSPRFRELDERIGKQADEITDAVTEQVLAPEFPWLTGMGSHEEVARIYAIVRDACGYEFRNHSHQRKFVRPRGVVAWIARERGIEFPAIARFFHQDHTAPMYMAKQIDSQIRKGGPAAKEIRLLLAKVEADS